MLALLLENMLVALHDHSGEIDLHFGDRSMYKGMAASSGAV